jgi:membrane protein DedA with SNARE-associated domain
LELLINAIFEIGYIGFFVYMIIVGTFVPLPTQLILLPAGYLASLGKMDFSTIAIVTTLGTTVGALINYTLAKQIARNFFLRRRRKVLRTIKRFFNQYGKASVLFAPLIPSMGQYISIPAGISRMPLIWFLPITYISNLLWNSTMLSLGYFWGNDAKEHADTIIFFLTIILLMALFSFGVYKGIKRQ